MDVVVGNLNTSVSILNHFFACWMRLLRLPLTYRLHVANMAC